MTEHSTDAPERDPLGARPPLEPLAFELAERRVLARFLNENPEPLRVARFVLEGELGSGGMGTVWRAHDEELGRAIALKFLRSEAADERGEQRLLEEAQALAQLSHPNVIPIYDVGRHEGRVWIAMEFVPGQTLRAWARTVGTRRRLEAWCDAGRGLAAVHQAGLIHRDVKPDNVLIGDDGRVRLIDFGLVRAPDAGVGSTDGGSSTARSGRGRELQTATGAFVGTRRYAAPEQRAGEAVDARADQYAFCVSLWESLCGELPSRTPLEDPAARRMGGRLRRALARGLDADPQRRFVDMDALLAAIAPRRGRWIAPALLGAVLLGGLGGVLSSREDPCAADPQALAGVWDEARRADLRAALEARGVDWSGAVVGAIDDWSSSWEAAQRRACEDTRVHGRHSDATLDRRSACLADLRRELAATVDLLASEAPREPQRASALVDDLPAPGICDEVEVLRLGPKPPRAPLLVGALDGELARLRARHRAGRLEGLDVEFDALEPQVEALDYAPLEAELLALRGRVDYDRGEIEAGLSRLQQAIDRAEASRHDRQAAQAWIWLATARARVGERPEDRSRALPRARAALERLDRPEDPLWLELALAEAIRDESEERWVAMVETLDAALARAREQLPAGHRLLITIQHRRANALGETGRTRDALVAFADAEAMLAGRWGLDNGWAAKLFQDRGAFELEVLGDVEAGRADLERARELYHRAGIGGLDLAWLEVALGMAAYLQGDFEAAEAAVREGLKLLEEVLGPTHPDSLMVLRNLGAVRFRRGDHAGAREAYTRAFDGLRETLGPDHPDVAITEANLGEALLVEGQAAQAYERLARAVVALEASLGAEHLELAPGLKALGLAALALERPGEARVQLERALAILEQQPEPNPAELAETCRGLARALEALGEEPERVHALSERARALAGPRD